MLGERLLGVEHLSVSVVVKTDISVVVEVDVFTSPTRKKRLAEINTPATTIAAAMAR
jgi:hypothetical protein